MPNAPEFDLSTIYMIVGTLVVMNLGGLGTGLLFVIRGTWAAARMYARIEKLESDVNMAHRKIRDLEKK
jgi:hypothetical protein